MLKSCWLPVSINEVWKCVGNTAVSDCGRRENGVGWTHSSLCCSFCASVSPSGQGQHADVTVRGWGMVLAIGTWMGPAVERELTFPGHMERVR